MSISTARTNMKTLMDQLNALFLDRVDVIKLLFTGLISGNNVFLGGPPGTGKTDLTNHLAKSLGLRSKYVLFGNDITQDAFIGGMDMVAYKANKFRRNLEFGICNAEVVAIDEIFKASTTALNTLS